MSADVLLIVVAAGGLIAVVGLIGLLPGVLRRIHVAIPDITPDEIADWVKTAARLTGQRVHTDCFDAWADGHPVSDDCAAMLGGPR